MITRENYEIWMLDYAEGRLDSAQQKLFLDFLEQNPDLKRELEAFEQISLNDEPIEKLSGKDLKKRQSWLLEKYNTDELIFHYNEGNLTAEELREWYDLIKARPELLRQAEKEKQLTLKPRLSETFGEKPLLKRQEAIYEITEENCTAYFVQYYETKELALHLAITGFLTKYPGLRTTFEQYGRVYLRPDLSVVFEEKSGLKKKEKVVAMYWWRYAAAAASVVLAVWLLYPGNKDTTPLKAQNGPDSLEKANPLVPEQNSLSPKDVIAEQHGNEAPEEEVRQEKVKQQQESHGQEYRNKKGPELIPENKKTPDPIAREEHKPEKDSVSVPPSPLNKEEQPLANDGNTHQENRPGLHGNDHIQTVDNPVELVSAVVNKKYYESETPRQQTSSTFYAMRNVVHTVSGGQADMAKKEDKDSKEFSLRIGNFGFSRKKHKRDE
jgi:hypothetical protein